MSSSSSTDGSCYCRRNVVQRTSWTALNPGRRYIACEKFKEPGGCLKFEWIDPPICHRAKNIIPGLLRRIGTLEDELQERRSELEQVVSEIVELRSTNRPWKLSCAKQRSL